LGFGIWSFREAAGGIVRTAAVILSAVGIILFAGCKKPNHAPDTPAVPSGPTSCAVGVSYTFSSSATDPDGDSVAIRFDWGDGDTSDWGAYVPSGDSVAMSYSWPSPGTFNVTVQSKDKDSVTLTWSAEHELTVYHEWAKTFGGADSEVGNSVDLTQDGMYIITGFTESSGEGSGDVWLVKVDAAGDPVWTKTFGGMANDEGNSVRQTQDGGYVIAGRTKSFGAGYYDVWLIKTDSDGNKLWDKVYGGAEGDRAYSVQQTRDGGYIIVGFTESFGTGDYDVWLLKTDANGDTLWTRTFGDSTREWGSSVQQTSDGGYIVSATVESLGLGCEGWLLKTDSMGMLVWSRTYSSVGLADARSVHQTPDGGYIVVGGTGHKLALLKTDVEGNKVWSRAYGGEVDDYGFSVCATPDGRYVAAGLTQSYGEGVCDFWLVKVDVDGDPMWGRTYGGPRFDVPLSVRQTKDGGFVVVGYTDSYGAGGQDVWLIKTGPNGEMDEDGGK
jgi:hypothetical protein